MAKGLHSNDTRLLVHIRKMIGFPSNCSKELIWCVCQLLPTCGVVARDMRRLQLQITLHAHANALSTQLYRALLLEPRSRSSVSGSLSNWAHTTLDAQRKAVRLGAIVDETTALHDISRAAHVTGRSLAFVLLQRKLRQAAPAPTDITGRISLPPDCHGSKKHLLSLSFGLPWTPADLGNRHGCSPLSMHGPGCSGSLLAIAAEGKYPA